MKKDEIEDLYSQLDAYSKAPPKELWDTIEARLHPKKKRRGILFFWGSAAAVAIVLLGYLYINLDGSGKAPINEISDTEQSIELNDETDTFNKVTQKNTTESEENIAIGADKDSIGEWINGEQGQSGVGSVKEQVTGTSNGNRQGADVDSRQINKKDGLLNKRERSNTGAHEINKELTENNAVNSSKYAQNNLKDYGLNEKGDKVGNKPKPNLEPERSIVISNGDTKVATANDSIVKENVTLTDLQETQIAENKRVADSVITDKDTNLKWSIEVLGGLANTASDASIQGTAVNTTSQNDFVYTLKVGYALTDRLVVKSGIGKNTLGQEINNIKYTSTDASLVDHNLQGNITSQDIIFLVSEESMNDFSIVAEAANEGSLQQQFDYIQVPIEFSYKVLQGQKVDVAIGVGGNINFLTGNRAFLDNEPIGENLGVNTTIYGATINSNMSYGITSKINLFLEPSYNYFDKPIDNNTQTFNNTQLRVLFGLQYKF